MLRSQKRTASRLKLKRLLLYILRTLILLAIPVALARPELAQAGGRGAASRRAGGHGRRAGRLAGACASWTGSSLFEHGRDEARDALAGLRPEEPATVLVCGPGHAAPPRPGFDRARLRATLDEASPPTGPRT